MTVTAVYDFAGEAAPRDLTTRRLSTPTRHAAMMSEYRDARAAWESWRESGRYVDTTGAAGANVAAYQLSTAELVAAIGPAPTLADYMRGFQR